MFGTCFGSTALHSQLAREGCPPKVAEWTRTLRTLGPSAVGGSSKPRSKNRYPVDVAPRSFGCLKEYFVDFQWGYAINKATDTWKAFGLHMSQIVHPCI